jgi:ABC-type lipoprotein release transport system permease subunit
VTDQEHNSKARDLKIARNEASREKTSSIRVTAWAIGIAVVLGLAVLVFVLILKSN